MDAARHSRKCLVTRKIYKLESGVDQLSTVHAGLGCGTTHLTNHTALAVDLAIKPLKAKQRDGGSISVPIFGC